MGGTPEDVLLHGEPVRQPEDDQAPEGADRRESALEHGSVGRSPTPVSRPAQAEPDKAIQPPRVMCSSPKLLGGPIDQPDIGARVEVCAPRVAPVAREVEGLERPRRHPGDRSHAREDVDAVTKRLPLDQHRSVLGSDIAGPGARLLEDEVRRPGRHPYVAIPWRPGRRDIRFFRDRTVRLYNSVRRVAAVA